MPKAPILSRTSLYKTLRDGTTIPLDYALVQTSIGAMIEFRSVVVTGPVNNRDPYDESVNGRMELDPSVSIFQLSGVNEAGCWPRNFNTQ